ncbi:hypothetical protein ACFV0T_18065 [Streptomyces sp. NPDC059582]|uniref:hypothetical protein n=1 Tax=Streptomyces sp. NPDC059582 TaxID=3346875 RepID=UPI0036BC562F
MLAVNRRLAGLALGGALALGGTAAVPAVADGGAVEAPARAVCHTPVGNSLIHQRWAALGGASGWMGCPTSGTRDVYVNNIYQGKRQYFAHGNITTSRAQGSRMVVAAWEANGYAHFNWGPTNPYHYDVFLFRYTSAADPQGRQGQVGGGSSGLIRVRKETTGSYTFRVEGCDRTIWGLKCKQGWTLSATTN